MTKPEFSALLRIGSAMLLLCSCTLARAQNHKAGVHTIEEILNAPVAAVLSQAAEDGVLSLDEAKAVALADNPGMVAAQARVEAAAAAVREARSAYYPIVDVVASAVHNEEQPVDTRGPNSSSQFYAVSGRLSWLLFDGFARRFRVAAASYGQAVARQGYRDAQRLLVEGVALSYYEALLAQETMAIARQDMEFNETLSAETRKRFEAGAASRSDVLNFEIRAAQAESSYLSAEHALYAAKVVLAELLGITAAILPETLEPETIDADVPETVPELAPEAEYALDHRPDYLQVKESIRQLEAEYGIVTADYLPTLALEAERGWARQDDIAFNNGRDSVTTAAIALNWEIFSGGRRQARQAGVAALIREARQSLASQRNAIVSQLRQRIDAVRLARVQVALQNRIQDMTDEARNLVRSEYLAGRTSLTRLNEAQTDLVRAQGQLALATIRYRQVKEQVFAASGRNLVLDQSETTAESP